MRDDQHEQVEDADVAVQIERALHLRQVVGAHERLLVDEQRGDDRDAGEIDAASGATNASATRHTMATTCIDARDRQRRRHAEPHRNRAQAVRAIELEILAGVEHVEAADPRADGQRRAATAPSRRARRPPASRRPAPPPSPGRGTAASRSCSASPASTRTRWRARPATAAKHSGFSRHAAKTNTTDATTTNADGLADGSWRRAAARDWPSAG